MNHAERYEFVKVAMVPTAVLNAARAAPAIGRTTAKLLPALGQSMKYLGRRWLPTFFRPSLTAAKATAEKGFTSATKGLPWLSSMAAKAPQALAPIHVLGTYPLIGMASQIPQEMAGAYAATRGAVGVDDMNTAVDAFKNEASGWNALPMVFAGMMPPDKFQNIIREKATGTVLDRFGRMGLKQKPGWGPRKWLGLDPNTAANTAFSGFLNEASGRALANPESVYVDWKQLFDKGKDTGYEGIQKFRDTLKPEQIDALLKRQTLPR